MAEKVLITGANGLLGQKAVAQFQEGSQVRATGIEPGYVGSEPVEYRQLDITDFAQIQTAADDFGPDLIFNAAAYTQVDRAETDGESCRRVNVIGPHNLAKICASSATRLIHISTDYVFDGDRGGYRETDPPNPINAYGQSKLDGERVVMDSGCQYLIARTAVLFGNGRQIPINFARWVARELSAGNPIRVVDDQIGNPTLAEHLAWGCHELLRKAADGLFHVVGPEALSRLDFAIQIAAALNLDPGLITRIKTSAFKQDAERPLDVTLNSEKMTRQYGVQIPSLEEALASFAATL